jgi:hypothetical protein
MSSSADDSTQEIEMNNTEHEMTRADLLGILSAIGGSGADTATVDDIILDAIVSSRLQLVTDVSLIDAALSRPLSVEWRGKLMARRIQLAQLAKIPAREPLPPKGLSVTVPAVLDSMTHFIDGNGLTYEVRVNENGQRVLDLTAAEFRAFLSGPNGLHWETANAGTDIWRRLEPGLHVN